MNHGPGNYSLDSTSLITSVQNEDVCGEEQKAKSLGIKHLNDEGIVCRRCNLLSACE